MDKVSSFFFNFEYIFNEDLQKWVGRCYVFRCTLKFSGTGSNLIRLTWGAGSLGRRWDILLPTYPAPSGCSNCCPLRSINSGRCMPFVSLEEEAWASRLV